MKNICNVSDCEKEAARLGMCHLHYGRFYRTGSVDLTRPFPEKRFWLKVKKTDTCWLWTGTVNKKTGYGRVTAYSQNILVHRFSYELAKGKIPQGLHIDHLCSNRICVNPDHLEAVTQKENHRRGKTLITHCPHGHPYSPENTYITTRGARNYRECGRKASRELWRRKHPDIKHRHLRVFLT